ncbi:protein kinase [Saccharothrix sp. 6-C]|uniref:serine/threonine-protein kinase n=1 Tax=Saccharothrix sp. 6-C TaxID=2781735 RepID=UPI00191736FF|nr:serine/threonine-protein kinase [Saccharothrix sp. 6-C]QQQ74364.1 protein kinase [Saccharothrix sp. 6-C]
MWDGDLTGEVVDGRYALGNLYGSGGMAEVYRALDTRLDRKVAIKFFLGEAAGEDRIRLDREAQVLDALRFPGLVEVYGTGSFRGRPYFVMQPVDGGTLRRRMRGAMAPEAVAAIGAQIAGVLAHVHANDVVHRDVKPSNILLDPTGRRAYLADFGLALQGQVTRVTRSGILVGTAGYLAPEQVRGGDVLPAADVYALGLVLLECLTGRPEYPGGDTEAALSRLHREPRIPVDLPDPWAAVLTAMTASDPAKRPSAAECERLLTEAQRASAGLSPLVAAAAVVDRPAVVEPEPRSDRRALLVGGAAAAVVLGLVGYLAMSGPSEPESGERAGRPTTTTTSADPLAEQARETGATAPGDPSAVTVVQVAPTSDVPAGSTGDDAAGGVPVTGTAATTTTTTATKTPPETPVDVPSNGPVVVLPNPGPPTVVTGPPSRDRGGSSGRG